MSRDPDEIATLIRDARRDIARIQAQIKAKDYTSAGSIDAFEKSVVALEQEYFAATGGSLPDARIDELIVADLRAARDGLRGVEDRLAKTNTADLHRERHARHYVILGLEAEFRRARSYGPDTPLTY